MPFSLLQGKGGILQGGPKALEQGHPTAHICFPSGSHSWWICIPRLSLQSHSPFKTNRGFLFVAANPCRHLRFSWVAWGPAGPCSAAPGTGSWRQGVQKGSFGGETVAPWLERPWSSCLRDFEGTPGPLDLPDPTPEAAPGVPATWPVCPPRFWGRDASAIKASCTMSLTNGTCVFFLNVFIKS